MIFLLEISSRFYTSTIWPHGQHFTSHCVSRYRYAVHWRITLMPYFVPCRHELRDLNIIRFYHFSASTLTQVIPLEQDDECPWGCRSTSWRLGVPFLSFFKPMSVSQCDLIQTYNSSNAWLHRLPGKHIRSALIMFSLYKLHISTLTTGWQNKGFSHLC